MQFTNETIQTFINEYSQRTGISKEKTLKLFQDKKLVVKYGSNGMPYLVDNPDYLSEDGKLKKVRSKNTNLTPKKKKRKK
jgi:hypothetical protein